MNTNIYMNSTGTCTLHEQCTVNEHVHIHVHVNVHKNENEHQSAVTREASPPPPMRHELPSLRRSTVLIIPVLT
jgi:hypothetical protein